MLLTSVSLTTSPGTEVSTVYYLLSVVAYYCITRTHLNNLEATFIQLESITLPFQAINKTPHITAYTGTIPERFCERF